MMQSHARWRIISRREWRVDVFLHGNTPFAAATTFAGVTAAEAAATRSAPLVLGTHWALLASSAWRECRLGDDGDEQECWRVETHEQGGIERSLEGRVTWREPKETVSG